MSATNSNSFLARLSIIKRLWLAFGLLVVLLVAGFGYGGYSLLSGQKDVSTLSVIGNDVRLATNVRGAIANFRVYSRHYVFTGDQKVIPLVRERQRELSARIAAGKAEMADPAFQRVMAEIDNLTSSYFATFDKIADFRTREDAVFRQKLEPVWERVAARLTEIKDVTAADGSTQAAFAASEAKEHWLLVRTFADHLLTTGDSAAKASVDANIGEMREHLGQLDSALKNPQLADRPHRGGQVVRRRFSGSGGFKPGSRPSA
jgi:methyl-accepting chemotaxis protein